MADTTLVQTLGTRSGDIPTITIPLTIAEIQNIALAAFIVFMCLVVWWVTKPAQSKHVTDHLKDHQWLIIPGFLWLCLLTILMAALLAIVWGIPEHLALANTAEASKNTTTYFFALTALTAVLAAVVALPFTVLRTIYTERQTRTAEQSHVTDQINKAVENLGARHSDQAPNIEVRIGGLLALERISRSSPDDHIQIMEILCAYIRENARAQVAAEVSFDEDDRLVGHARTLRDDLLTAFDIIDRRAHALKQIENDNAFRLNFKYADFRGLNLSHRNLNNAELHSAQIQGAILGMAEMQGADLRVVEMQGAYLSGAQMQGADLYRAEMQDANLFRAEMQGADLFHAEMKGAYLGGAEMQGAYLNVAEMDADTELIAAVFQGAALRVVDFTKVSISDEQLNDMFGDATVTLPGGNGVESDAWPEKWPKRVLEWDFDPEKSEFHQAWRAWQDQIGFDRETNTLKQPTD